MRLISLKFLLIVVLTTAFAYQACAENTAAAPAGTQGNASAASQGNQNQNTAVTANTITSADNEVSPKRRLNLGAEASLASPTGEVAAVSNTLHPSTSNSGGDTGALIPPSTVTSNGVTVTDPGATALISTGTTTGGSLGAASSAGNQSDISAFSSGGTGAFAATSNVVPLQNGESLTVESAAGARVFRSEGSAAADQ